MARAYVALGSNLGDRAAMLESALAALRQTPGIQVVEVSSFHETKPVGGPPGQHDYLNAAAALDTTLDAVALLKVLLQIEQKLGRVRSEKNAPRVIDLDLLLYDDVVRSDDPILPHPRMHEREFVLAPLAEVAPDVIHTPSSLRVRELLSKMRGHSPSPFRVDGLRVLVTGSTSGIGKVIAESMAQQGADVIIHGRRPMLAHEVAESIRGRARRSAAAIANLMNSAETSQLIDQAWSHWNGLDVLVNNAGADTLTGEAAHWTFDQKLQALWLVDVQVTIRLSRAIGERMKKRGRGCIINIGWDQAEIGMEGDSGQLFAATKAAVMSFTKSLAKSLAPEVRVNCISPGWVKTSWGESASKVWQDRVVSETPLGRWGTPADVAAAACWLASPAASFITGQIIRVNGGAVM
jgi:2-amino-4-hydroxy-6-hydroxymethyldihydropteridine diphosphokinase